MNAHKIINNVSLLYDCQPMSAWKYIQPVDENTVVWIYGTTCKLRKKSVCSVMSKAGFYNHSHTTSEHRDCYP